MIIKGEDFLCSCVEWNCGCAKAMEEAIERLTGPDSVIVKVSDK